jgi:molybdenum cofactor synthesis domain-containing protein
LELELFEKTEIWISPIQIKGVNLGVVAEKVAEVLNLDKREVLVIDAGEDIITLDITRRIVNAQDIIGKKGELLRTLAEIPGISLTPETSIHSEGILGLIDIEDQKAAQDLLRNMEETRQQISDRIQKRAIIFPSGFEIQRGLVQDTNTPHIKKRLTEEGYEVWLGGVLEDNLNSIVASLNNAVNRGFGLIVTTGGVGAEHKDRMVEALLELDSRASTPYIIRYEKGTGRHEKDGVKIGVAYCKPTLIVALPGPHEEVKIGIETVIEGLKRGADKETLALALSKKMAGFLRNVQHIPGQKN